MSDPTVAISVEDKIMTILLNRPEALNAYNRTMHEELLSAFDEADANDDVRVVILTGAGRGFCAGADLGAGGSTFDRADKVTVDTHRDGGGELTQRIFRCKKPIIAAINGPATGVGLTMTLPCDFRLASEKSKMGFVFVQRGIAPDACSSWFAPRVVGITKALDWFLTGRVFSAREAYEGGLVTELLAPEDLLPRAHEIARSIADKTSAVSAAIVRKLLWQMLGSADPEDAFKKESKALFFVGSGADAREGVTSFLEKRPAEFTMSVSRDFPDFLDD
ncbi:MAG: enoyl-CoA hydratase-related protein [Gammaproteobacteria bacterium]|jgi:enoyl-CoA hydratase/carnithine racemase